MPDVTSEASDHFAIFVLTGFRFILPFDAPAFESFEGPLTTDLG